jgi:hypothetical protein
MQYKIQMNKKVRTLLKICFSMFFSFVGAIAPVALGLPEPVAKNIPRELWEVVSVFFLYYTGITFDRIGYSTEYLSYPGLGIVVPKIRRLIYPVKVYFSQEELHKTDFGSKEKKPVGTSNFRVRRVVCTRILQVSEMEEDVKLEINEIWIDKGCDSLFWQCISSRQLFLLGTYQYARGDIGKWLATLIVTALTCYVVIKTPIKKIEHSDYGIVSIVLFSITWGWMRTGIEKKQKNYVYSGTTINPTLACHLKRDGEYIIEDKNGAPSCYLKIIGQYNDLHTSISKIFFNIENIITSRQILRKDILSQWLCWCKILMFIVWMISQIILLLVLSIGYGKLDGNNRQAYGAALAFSVLYPVGLLAYNGYDLIKQADKKFGVMRTDKLEFEDSVRNIIAVSEIMVLLPILIIAGVSFTWWGRVMLIITGIFLGIIMHFLGLEEGIGMYNGIVIIW